MQRELKDTFYRYVTSTYWILNSAVRFVTPLFTNQHEQVGHRTRHKVRKGWFEVYKSALEPVRSILHQSFIGVKLNRKIIMVMTYERIGSKCPLCKKALRDSETKKLIYNILLIITIYLFFWYLMFAGFCLVIVRQNHWDFNCWIIK